MDSGSLDGATFRYPRIIQDICDLSWSTLDEGCVVDAAWGYYFFSVQFQENLDIARKLYPDDPKLQDLERAESNTDNLSPWPGVAAAGERMNHCEFMRRVLSLMPLPDAKRRRFEENGEHYLRAIRKLDPLRRALSIASYEDGGLERVFGAMLRSLPSDHPVVGGFRYFLFTHIEFDSDPSQGHGALTRHLRPDDRVLPLWTHFRDLLVAFVPSLVAPSTQSSAQNAADAA
ncbi:MAG TPA: hypothetical protein VNF99_20435 [Stellaceae bacterium]|nr:hypothetical protein [Stellaceae bacterium]